MSSRPAPSLTLRLTLLFTLASTSVLILLGVLIGHAVEEHFEEQDMEALSGKMTLTRHALEKALTMPGHNPLAQLMDDALIGHHGLIIAIYGPGRQLIYSNGHLDRFQLLVKKNPSTVARPLRWVAPDGQPWRGIASVFPEGSEAGSAYTIIVATEISHHEHFMHDFRNRLWLFISLAAVAMGLLGWGVARRELRPLQSIKKRAEEITANRLYTRLPVQSIPRELADLAETLNGMLSRLEDSFQRLTDFSSDLAHELRTPVSNLLTQTQVTLSRARTPDEYREILASNAEEFERLSRMIADMLFLAQAENGRIIPSLEQVDLADEVPSLLEFYKILAEEKNIHLSIQGRGLVSGDRLMLRRAISNLLSNALRHTPDGGRIEVNIALCGETVCLDVKNTGVDIPEAHLSRLFDRFYRVDSSRQRTTEGAGLGLAIVRSIIGAHGGSVTVTSANGITCFTLCMPASGQTSCD